MKRSTLNFLIDLISFINLLGMIITGVIIKYILPPGTGGGHGRGFRGGRGLTEEVRALWSMTRHEWGDIHFYLSVLFIALIMVHIILHWTWIKCYTKSVLGLQGKDSLPNNEVCDQSNDKQ